jgi:hypothetical protein
LKIHELEITNVRGIRHVVLTLGGKNLVIWGPNGSGKSAVVDAIEFLLQGRISRLAGSGTAGISLRAHGPHIDCAADTAVVRAVMEIPGVEGTFEACRSIGAPDTLTCPDEVKDQLSAVAEVASSGQYVLARREILSFITATGGDRALATQRLLRLEGLENTRKVLARAARAASSAATAARTDVKSAESDFAVTAGLDKWTEAAALVKVNQARAVLGGNALETLWPGEITADLEPQGLAARDAQALRLCDLAPALKARWATEAVALLEETRVLHDSIEALSEDPVLLARLDRHDLIESGIALIPSDGSCPLCESEWEPGALKSKLESELVALRHVAERRDSVCREAARVRAKVRSLRNAIEEVRAVARGLEFISEEGTCATWVASLDGYDDSLGRLLSRIDAQTAADTEPPRLLAESPDEGLLDELACKAKAMNPDVTPEQKAAELLGRLSENLKTTQRKRENLDRASRLAARSRCLSDSFTRANSEILNELYESVKERFVALYSSLHSDDGEKNFAAILMREDAALQFEVEFFNRGMHPPHALHSEGHQDSMGICLYLALAERVNSGLINLVVLDDVVMSVDSGHRKKLARLLSEEFEGTQFVITTHERAWAQQLRSEGIVDSERLVQFCDWSVETGPRQNEPDVWNRIADCLTNDDVRGAAAYLRGTMEESFAQACEDLEAQVVYRGTAAYTLGDFLPAAWSRYARLVKQAKAAANSWAKDGEVARLAEIHSVAQQCWEATTAEQWAVNKGVHYDQWVDLSREDLTDVVAAFHDLQDVFFCSSCGKPLRLARAGATPVSVQCPCGQVNWNLQQKA